MEIKTVHAVYFSPAGHTQSVVRQIADTLAQGGSRAVEEDDFTLPDAREHTRTYAPDDLVVFGVPTYAGRVPNKILPFVQTLFEGNKTPAVAVVTFGNRSYDESLKELCTELSAHGFFVSGGGAFVCAHAMSKTLAADRPDAQDAAKMKALAEEVLRKVRHAENPEALCMHAFDNDAVGPYYRPLEESGEPANFLKAKPVTDKALCVGCGICARVCPMGSIDPQDVTLTPGICIKCHACVRKCPVQAKSFDDASLASHIRMLENSFSRRAESFILF